MKEEGKITNKEYQEANDVISRTALRDLDDLRQGITLGYLGFNP